MCREPNCSFLASGNQIPRFLVSAKVPGITEFLSYYLMIVAARLPFSTMVVIQDEKSSRATKMVSLLLNLGNSCKKNKKIKKKKKRNLGSLLGTCIIIFWSL